MILTLPNEILEDVLANVDFVTLRLSVRLVCRRLRDIIDSTVNGTGALARALFRNGPHPRPGGSEFDYELHPILKHIFIKQRDEIYFPRPVEFWQPDVFTAQCCGGKFIPVCRTSMAIEPATWPPVDSYLNIDFGPGTRKSKWMQISEPDEPQVKTVLDVLRAVSFWIPKSYFGGSCLDAWDKEKCRPITTTDDLAIWSTEWIGQAVNKDSQGTPTKEYGISFRDSNQPN